MNVHMDLKQFESSTFFQILLLAAAYMLYTL